MVKMFVFFWCLAGLLTLDVILRTPSSRLSRPPRSAAIADSLPAVNLIRTRCELPAGTVVFVVRGREPAP